MLESQEGATTLSQPAKSKPGSSSLIGGTSSQPATRLAVVTAIGRKRPFLAIWVANAKSHRMASVCPPTVSVTPATTEA